MPLPTTVRVKLSSEVAESISITPVVLRDIPIRELIEHMIGITGKDESRLHDLLLRGTLVSGVCHLSCPFALRCEVPDAASKFRVRSANASRCSGEPVFGTP